MMLQVLNSLIEKARPTGIFNTIESPALFNNSNITNVITGGY